MVSPKNFTIRSPVTSYPASLQIFQPWECVQDSEPVLKIWSLAGSEVTVDPRKNHWNLPDTNFPGIMSLAFKHFPPPL